MNIFWIGVVFLNIGPLMGLKISDKTLTKSGDCPMMNSSDICPTLEPNRCAVDIDCNNTEKCCFDGCILRCRLPYKHEIKHPNVCEAAVDLGFLIDSSASIGYQNFKGVRKMVDRIVNVFTISLIKTHVGIIMIDDVPVHVLKFNTFKGKDLNSNNVRRIVDNLQFSKGKTRIDLALRMAYKEMFSKKNGGRSNARKILIVFTDGLQTWAPSKMVKLSKASEPLKRIGVKIFPVGVWGEQINVGSLLDISMDNYSVYNMDFFPELLQALKKMSKIPCKDKAKGVKEWNRMLKKMLRKNKS